MSAQPLQAISIVLCASVMNAAYTLPMRLNRLWKWEQSWFAFSVAGVVVVPTVIALLTVPRLWATYEATGTATLVAMLFFGAGWGVSLMFFGLALKYVGQAITFAVSLGTSAAVGALAPLIVRHPADLLTRRGILILTGVGIILLGVGICGAAGQARAAAQGGDRSNRSTKFWRGFLLAIVSGVLGSMLNLGLAFGGSIQEAARRHGATPAMMSNAVWLPCLYAGFLPGAIYCWILMRRGRSLSALRCPGSWYYWLAAASMGLLWFGSLMLYSFSTIKLGELGTSIGWPVFLASIVVASSAFGVAAGEWSRTGKRPLQIMVVGVSVLVLAIVTLSHAGQFPN